MSCCGGVSFGLNEWGPIVNGGLINPLHIIYQLIATEAVDCLPMVIEQLDIIEAQLEAGVINASIVEDLDQILRGPAASSNMAVKRALTDAIDLLRTRTEKDKP